MIDNFINHPTYSIYLYYFNKKFLFDKKEGISFIRLFEISNFKKNKNYFMKKKYFILDPRRSIILNKTT